MLGWKFSNIVMKGTRLVMKGLDLPKNLITRYLLPFIARLRLTQFSASHLVNLTLNASFYKSDGRLIGRIKLNII